jgi:HlyD family secretion protein
MFTFISRHKKLVSLGAVIVASLGYYFFWSGNTQTTAVKYVTAKAERGSITASVSGSGNVVVDQLATVDPTISGTVANVAVNVGDAVKKGQLLFTIVNDDLTASTLQSQVSLRNAEIAVSQAKANLFSAKNGGSELERDRAILRTKVDVAEESLRVAKLNYTNALSDSAKRQVRAPIDGTVNAVNIKNGDDLSRLSNNSSSEAPIIIGDLKTLKAQVEVNEVDIPNIVLGQKVMMTYSAIDDLTVSGKIEKMDALGTITSGVVNYTVTIGFDSVDSRLRPGMSVSAKIIIDVKQDVITVPNSALKVKNNKTYLEVLNSATRLPEQRTIELGLANTTHTEIVSGVAVGDDVVTQTINPTAKTATTNSNVRIPGLGGGR